jgi:hypothetical protein
MGWSMIIVSIVTFIIIVLFFGGILAILGATAANGG